MVEQDVRVNTNDVSPVDDSRVNVVKVIPLAVGRVLARCCIVSGLEIGAVVIANGVKVVDVVVVATARWR